MNRLQSPDQPQPKKHVIKASAIPAPVLAKAGSSYPMERSNSFSSYAPNGASSANPPPMHQGNLLAAQKDLVQAKTISFGYFIAQPDSPHNTIIPVLPRLTKAE